MEHAMPELLAAVTYGGYVSLWKLIPLVLLFFACAAACVTRFGNKFAMTVTMGTGGTDGKKTA